MRSEIALTFVLLSGVAAQCGSPHWERATSDAGCAVDYPGAWYPGSGAGQISIANFPPGSGAEGVVIGRGEATISVFIPPTAPSGSLGELARWEARGDIDLIIRAVDLRPAYAGGCTAAVESDSLNEVGPGAYQQETTYYCKISGNPIAIRLVNWRGDPRLAEYRSVLLRVAESLRPTLPQGKH